ncbi:MAG: fibronectin type III domain-containing protein [Bdellovibrionales bacterium]
MNPFAYLLLTVWILVSCGGQPTSDPDPVELAPKESNPGVLMALPGTSLIFASTEISNENIQTLQLQNDGEKSLINIVVSDLSGDFQYTGGSFPGTNGTCNNALTNNQSCLIEISFTPTSSGIRESTISINFNNGDANTSSEISLSGEGLLPPAPLVLGLSDIAATKNADLNWSCDQICEFRYVVNSNPTHVFSSEAFDTTTNYTQNTGNELLYIHVQARDLTHSQESAVVSVSFRMDTTQPAMPTNVSFNLDATESSSSTLNWDASTDDFLFSHYELSIGLSEGATDISDWVNVGDVTSAFLSGLSISDGINYFTNIRAVDAAGNPSEIESSDFWNVPGPPEAINSLAVSSALTTEISIGWSAPYHNGSSISDYIVEYRVKDDTDWILLAEGVGTDTNSTITGLSPSTQYEFNVRAYNGSTSPASNLIVGETAPDNPFFEATTFKAMNLGGATKSSVVAFYDATEIKDGETVVATLNSGETAVLDTYPNQILSSEKEFFVAGRLSPNSNDTVQENGQIVWNTPDWSGKEFIFTGTRDAPHIITVYAFEDTDMSVFRGGTLDDSETILAGENHTFSLTNNGGFKLVSTGLIIAYMYSSSGGRVSDPRPLLPASTDILGIPSTKAMVASATDSTNLDLNHSDSHQQDQSLNSGSALQITGRGSNSLYQGYSLRITADQPIVANSNADSNGYCSAPFVPTSMLKKKFALNTEAEYVAFASLVAGTITVTEPDGTVSTVDLVRSGINEFAPFKARLTDLPAGTIFTSDSRYQAWYEPKGYTAYQSDDDETIMFGFD